ncbi:MAG: glycosyltransferase [Acidobacteria bacterium]|nr:glycosyltransferase [Acidobacteriota bacterium]
MEIKRIAILTLSVGAGHLRASQAIHQALHDGADNVDARLIDALELAKPWFHRIYGHPYWRAVRRTRWAWRNAFARRQWKRHEATALDWVFRRGCRGGLEQLRAFRPHLVIATEVGAAELAALGRREGWFDASILAAQTDFHTGYPWVKSEIDIYCVGSDEAKRQLIAWGVSANRILTCGISVDPAFALNFDRTELRRALGLDVKRPVILVMGGGMQPASLDAVVRSLEVCRQPLQVIAVAGRSRTLRLQLEALRRQIALDLHIFGWTDAVPELMGAASVLITRPGGVKTAEAMAAGVPMILTPPIRGAEERHLQWLVQQKVALSAERPEEIPVLVSRLLESPEQRELLEKHAREMARPDAAYAVAQVARALLEKATFIDLLAAPSAKGCDSAYVM